ncbi:MULTISPECIES: V-type ATP synthase subunit E [unclassified Ruminococcus]|uniref:V-type ATP synthase subunit E n=1 Tax=unclassified Ruminococcus TaxID=2608920 RepID=UPI00210B57AD|nr:MULTISPECIES: V-type ATP synthase subunit E [unclassified Ruminococcus]
MVSMSPDTKTGNFLNAIQKFADEQKHMIRSEVEKFKAEELKKAEDEGIRDAHALIQREMASMRAGIAGELAKKEDEGKRALYKRREEMVREIFEKSKDKLLDYTKTAEYKAALKNDAQQAADFFGSEELTVYLKSDDMALEGELSTIFGNNCSFTAASDIIIGGFKAQCGNRGIVVDFTLDTKLENQKGWFLQNSNLKI